MGLVGGGGAQWVWSEAIGLPACSLLCPAGWSCILFGLWDSVIQGPKMKVSVRTFGLSACGGERMCGDGRGRVPCIVVGDVAFGTCISCIFLFLFLPRTGPHR